MGGDSMRRGDRLARASRSVFQIYKEEYAIQSSPTQCIQNNNSNDNEKFGFELDIVPLLSSTFADTFT